MVYYVCVFDVHKPMRRNMGFVFMYTYFKWCHKRYCSETINDIVLLWSKSDTCQHFLGSFKENKIVETEKYHELEWDVQKGADRLYRLVLEKYWCRDFKKNKGTVTAGLQIVGTSINIWK